MKGHETIIEGQSEIKDAFLNEFNNSIEKISRGIERSEYRLSNMMIGVGSVLENTLGKIKKRNMQNYSELMKLSRKFVMEV